jgi:hypothetical protein
MRVTRDHIIAEIRRVADEIGGKSPGKKLFESETGIRESDWRGVYWAKWSEALAQAGHAPNMKTQRYPEEMIMSKLISLIQREHAFPTQDLLKLKRREDRSFPSFRVFRRLGTKAEIARKVVACCEDRDDLREVGDICRRCATTSIDSSAVSIGDEAKEFGFVYPMKSGSYYKIGRSNCAERREFELKLQLPEKVMPVHKIKTDDPVGIEEYWHRRFKDSRKGGEWFALSASDVKAFRRRKFM